MRRKENPDGPRQERLMAATLFFPVQPPRSSVNSSMSQVSVS